MVSPFYVGGGSLLIIASCVLKSSMLTQPLSCDFSNIEGTCLAEYTLPEARPTTWSYKYAANNDMVVDCGINLNRYVYIQDIGSSAIVKYYLEVQIHLVCTFGKIKPTHILLGSLGYSERSDDFAERFFWSSG
jgi:hypothetical protein